MKMKLILGLSLILLGIGVSAQKGGKPPLQFIKTAGIVLIEYDPARATATLNGPSIAMDIWVCTRYESGKTCKKAGDVARFLLQDGQSLLQDTK